VNANDYKVLSISNVLLVVVCLVRHRGLILGRGYDLAIYYRAILGELEVYLVAIDINGLDAELIALFQLERCARGNGHLIVVVHQYFQKLFIDQQISVGGLLVKLWIDLCTIHDGLLLRVACEEIIA